MKEVGFNGTVRVTCHSDSDASAAALPLAPPGLRPPFKFAAAGSGRYAGRLSAGSGPGSLSSLMIIMTRDSMIFIRVRVYNHDTSMYI